MLRVRPHDDVSSYSYRLNDGLIQYFKTGDNKMEKQYVANLLYASNVSLKQSKKLAEVVCKLTPNEIESLLSALSVISWNRKLAK